MSEEAFRQDQAKVIFSHLPDGIMPKWFLLGGPADGNEAQCVKEQFPTIQVIAVEPYEPFCKWQRENGFPEDGVIINKALHQCCGESIIKMDTESPRNSSLSLPRPGDWTPCYTVTWDALSDVFGPFSRAIMWMDIEGSEAPALYGARRLFESGSILIVNIEVIERYETTIEVIESFLSMFGFSCVRKWNKHPGHHDRVYVRV